MTLSLVYEYRGQRAVFTYNGPPCFIAIAKFYTTLGAKNDEVIEKMIEAFESVIDETLFEPAQYLINADQPHFLQAVLACTNSVPEILGAATEGYVYRRKGQGRGTRSRYSKGLVKYILPGLPPDERDKIETIHYKQIRNPISHSFVVSYIWMDSEGDSTYVNSEEIYDRLHKSADNFENREALLKHLRDNPYAIARINVVEWTDTVRQGFKKYLSDLRSGDALLRDNFMKYITQQEHWLSILESRNVF